MTLQYNISDFQDTNDFLSKMAVKMGSLKRGGVPDIHKAAQRVLSDWTNGKLTFFTEPPERTSEIISTELVTQMKEAFDIDALLNYENEHVQELETDSCTETSIALLTQMETDHEMKEQDNVSENEYNTSESMDEDDRDSRSTTDISNQVF